MGSLEEWIRLYRRADVGPAPAPTTEPVEVAAAASGGRGDARRIAAPARPTTRLLYGTLPLMGASVTAILVALGVTAAVRRIRLASRTPSR